MSKKEKRSLRKTILIIIVLLLFIIFAVATYAWLSVQRDVEITGLNVKIEVSEKLEISLNGDEWTDKIEITDMNQLLGTAGTGHQARAGDNNNYIPNTLIPVSTTGSISNGFFDMVIGDYDGKTLENIRLCNENNLTQENNRDHPYLVFDLYLKDTTQNPASIDQIYLDAGSSVFAEIDDVGLAESSRVGFIAYNTNTAELTASGGSVRALTGGSNDIAAIWEPNYLRHTQHVVESDSRVTSTSQEIPAYGLRTSAVGSIIENVEDTGSGYLGSVTTNKTPQDSSTHETTQQATLTCTDGSTTFGIRSNRITKVRTYIWLEGQDPDCVNLASTGKVINANFKFIKDIVNAP